MIGQLWRDAQLLTQFCGEGRLRRLLRTLQVAAVPVGFVTGAAALLIQASPLWAIPAWQGFVLLLFIGSSITLVENELEQRCQETARWIIAVASRGNHARNNHHHVQ